jgi:integrase
MAKPRKLAGGKWRAEFMQDGIRQSKVCDNKREALDWTARQVFLIKEDRSKVGVVPVPFGDVLRRYSIEVSPRKKGVRWERLRLDRFLEDDFAKIAVQDLTPLDFAKWRDARLREVAPGTVNREMTLLSGVLTVARKEWGLIIVNPIRDVRKPTKPPSRYRIANDDELARLAFSAGSDLNKLTARAFHAFLFAIETAMRAGEIIGLDWARVDLKTRVCHLAMTKNGTSRDVPLSFEAVRLIEALPRKGASFDQKGVKSELVFDLNSSQLDALWRKLRDRAAVVNLTFYDSRHIAITRLAKKIEVLDLARMVGHRNLNELLTYYNASAADLAKQLD